MEIVLSPNAQEDRSFEKTRNYEALYRNNPAEMILCCF